MVALSERKIALVKGLVAAAPDKVVGGLQAALADHMGDSPLANVRKLVEAEAAERRLRNVILQPIVPMCVGHGTDPHGLHFPSIALGYLWKGLKALDPAGVDAAARALYDYRPGESSNAPFDALVQRAADAVRAGEPREFMLVKTLCEGARPGGGQAFQTCLDLAPVVRRAAHRLPEWTAHFGDDTTAAARLAYRDACQVSDDAGPTFFEMLAAQLPSPWMVLRIISAVMDKPTERYLAQSEFGAFAERLMDDIDEGLRTIQTIDADGGEPVAREAAKLVEQITLQIAEIETCIAIEREQGWGHRLFKQKAALASVVEGRIREADKYASLALPMQPARLRRIRRMIPRHTLPPDEKAVRRAITLLHFAREIRSSANYGGFASARSRMLDKVGDMLDHYVEETLDLIKTGDCENEAVAREHLAVVVEFSILVRDEKAADLVRRRAAACEAPKQTATGG
ncbi:hypothetical protein [Phenylobacterium sp. J367]|uniref:hypothetical protein n=1 Tax=Phenylobacterium sp. J367 TaxID=2898435 RepID=UPI002151B5C1|nr:hypothetical protein [Phenylobacterium sp. J367]MCR5878866.1 hypothetical protein [Phenylobacterium sp. J367]